MFRQSARRTAQSSTAAEVIASKTKTTFGVSAGAVTGQRAVSGKRHLLEQLLRAHSGHVSHEADTCVAC